MKIVSKIKIIIFFISYGIIFTGVQNFRNDLYVPLYSSIDNKNGKELKMSVFKLSMLATFIFSLDFISEFFKEYMAFRNRKKTTPFLESHEDLSQHLSVDQKTIVENYCAAFFNFFPSLFVICFFAPKMFKIIGKDYILIGGLLGYIVITFLSIGLFKYFYGIFYKKNVFLEEKIRLYFHSWFDTKKMLPINFNKETYRKNIKGLLIVGLFNSFNKAAITLYQSISLVLPYVIFLSHYLSGEYNFGVYMQLINIWASINYSIQGLFQGWENYSAFKVNENRMTWALKNSQDNLNYGSSIKLRNVKLSFEEKNVLYIEDVLFEVGKVVNVYGKHGSGKTSLAKIIAGILKSEGYVETIRGLVYIPEGVRIPQDTEFENTEEFIRYCKIFKVDPLTVFETACGSEKWRLIMSYALSLNKYVIIDDPFWGDSEMEQKEKLVNELNQRKGGLIFSSTEINGSCEKICFEQINLAY